MNLHHLPYSVILSIALLIIVSCYTPTEYVTTGNADLSKYQYAFISDLGDYSGNAALYDVEVSVYNALAEAGFKMVGEEEATELNEDKQSLLIRTKFAVSQSPTESVVTVTFYDYQTGRLLGNVTGAHGTGWTVRQDLRRATEKATTEVKQMFAQDRQ